MNAPLHASQMIITLEEGETRESVERAFKRLVRKEVQAGVREEQDRQSFAAAGEYMTLSQTVEYTGISRNHLLTLRTKRKRFKSEKEKNRACFPEYHRCGSLCFKRSEVDAWIQSTKV